MARIAAVVTTIRLREGFLGFGDRSGTPFMPSQILLIRAIGHEIAAIRRIVDLVVAIRLRLLVHDEIGHDCHSKLGG